MQRAICTLDLESTGLDISTARIIQAAASVPGREPFNQLVYPECSIPAKVVELTRITDERVKDAPTFRDIAPALLAYIDGCDLVTFGGANFDIPLLAEEFARAGIDWDWTAHRIFDIGVLAKKLNPNSLCATYERMTGQKMADAHDALADVQATECVFNAILRQHLELGRLAHEDRDALAVACRYDDEAPRLDPAGKIVEIGGQPCFNTFRNRGVRVADDIGYAEWMISRGTFPMATKAALERILAELERGPVEPVPLFSDPGPWGES